MAFLPIPSVTPTTQLISMVSSVVSSASATFADLLNLPTNNAPSSTGSSLLEGLNAFNPSSSSHSRLSLGIENQARLDDFRTALVEDLRELGVDLSAGIELAFSKDGNLEVVGDHPDKAVIENALAGNTRYFEAAQKIAVNAVLTDKFAGESKNREFRLLVTDSQAQAQFV